MRAKTRVNSPFTSVAETLVDNGYCAIPIKPETKRPGNYTQGNWYGDLDWTRFCDRLPTDIELNTWTAWPDAGVCIALDQEVKVIDIDTDDQEIIDAILAVLPESPVAKRGEKGASYFYRGSPEVKNRPYKLRLSDGTDSPILDLLAHGRQTVLPPTIHPGTGKPYVWITEDTLEDITPEDLPLLPDNIADLLEQALVPFGEVVIFKRKPANGAEVLGDTIWDEVNAYALQNLDTWVPDLPAEANAIRSRDGSYRLCAFWRGVENNNVGVHSSGIVDWGGGEGHTPINLVMQAHGHPYFEYAFEWLREKIGYEPKETLWDEMAKTMANNLIKSTDEQKRMIAEVTTVIAPVDTTETVAIAPIDAPRSEIDPFTPEAAGGLMGLIAQWSLDSSRRPVREFAIMSAIGFMSALFGRRVVGPTGLGTNLYMVGIAAPGFGKEQPLRTLKNLAADCGMSKLIGPGEVTSGTAIEKVLRRQPSQIMPWDEFGVVLKSVNGRSASSWAQTIRKVLLELYSKSTDIWSGKEHADPTRSASEEPIYSPTLSMLGMATPVTFYAGLTEESLSDGFLARLTVVHAKTRPDRQEAPPQQITPVSLIAEVKRVLQALPVTTLTAARAHDTASRPNLYTVEWDSVAAKNRFLAIEDWQIAQIEDHGGQDGLIGRTAEQTLKFATIRALSRDSSKPRVRLDDVEWGYAIVQRSVDCLESGVEEYMSGSIFQELCKAVLRALKESKKGQLSHAAMLRKKGVGIHDARMVKSAYDRLHEMGDIERPASVSGGLRITLAKTNTPQGE